MAELRKPASQVLASTLLYEYAYADHMDPPWCQAAAVSSQES